MSAVTASKQSNRIPRTTVALKRATKSKLDKSRAPGQCYDGFICQMLQLWEKNGKRR